MNKELGGRDVHAKHLGLLAAATGILATCTNQPTPSAFSLAAAPAPHTSSADVIISPSDAPAKVDYYLQGFSKSVFQKAQQSGKDFPAYNKWLSYVAATLVKGGPFDDSGSLNPVFSELAEAGNAELSPYKSPPPPPSEKDLEVWRVYGYSTDLKEVPKNLEVFLGQSSLTREAASTYLKKRYSLP